MPSTVWVARANIQHYSAGSLHYLVVRHCLRQSGWQEGRNPAGSLYHLGGQALPSAGWVARRPIPSKQPPLLGSQAVPSSGWVASMPIPSRQPSLLGGQALPLSGWVARMPIPNRQPAPGWVAENAWTRWGKYLQAWPPWLGGTRCLAQGAMLWEQLGGKKADTQQASSTTWSQAPPSACGVATMLIPGMPSLPLGRRKWTST